MKRAVTIGFILALPLLVLAADQWSVFAGQKNGPVATPGGIDLETFKHKKYPGIFWSEGYYHHLNFPDGSMITVAVGFNVMEASVIFVYGRPGMEPFRDYILTDVDDVKFDEKGFGVTIGENRMWLEGDKYHMNLDFGKVKAKISYDIQSASYAYGDGMVRYPDGKSYSYYSLPIPWAKAKVDAVLDGKKYSLEGFGSMNHDAQVLSPIHTPSRWRVFWFFGDDHALAVTNLNTHDEFGGKLVQRLVFVDKDGNMFTSTGFPIKWDDWVEAKDISFRYPLH